MLIQGIASILHRDTIAVLVGTQTFERGEECFRSKRVLAVESARGELRGKVKPTESQRAHYACRIWLREEGVAYECTCPIGVKRQFCKHAVAIALAHLANERAEAEAGLGVLREAMTAIGHPALVEGLLGLAKRDHDLADSLKRMCLESLSKRP
jgi:uncharacterized Zn finger protein